MSENLIAQSKILKNIFYEHLATVKPLIVELNSFLTVHDSEPTMFTTVDQIVENSFSIHMKLLTDSGTIKSITELINKYYDWVKHNPEVSVKLTPRVFLSAWTISSYPEIVLDTKREQIAEGDTCIVSIFNAATNFISIINKTIETPTPDNFIDLISCLNTYSNTFNYFLHRDKIKKIKDLAVQWYGLGKNIKLIEESKKYGDDQKKCLNEISKTRATIEKHIKNLSPTFDLDELKKFETLADNAELTALKAYKDILYDDINKKKYDYARKIMNEIKKAFVVMNKNLEGELNDFYDVEFLIHQHKNNILTTENIYGLGNYLVSKIKSLESPAGEPETMRKWNDIISAKETDINRLITNILLFIMDEIEDIKHNIVNLQIMLSLGINPFTK